MFFNIFLILPFNKSDRTSALMRVQKYTPFRLFQTFNHCFFIKIGAFFLISWKCVFWRWKFFAMLRWLSQVRLYFRSIALWLLTIEVLIGMLALGIAAKSPQRCSKAKPRGLAADSPTRRDTRLQADGQKGNAIKKSGKNPDSKLLLGCFLFPIVRKFIDIYWVCRCLTDQSTTNKRPFEKGFD